MTMLPDTRPISIADASQVTINGNQVTINLSSDLKAGLTYSVQMGSGVLLGESGLAYAGLADASKLNFAVSAASVPLPGDKVEVSIDGQTWHTATVNGNSWSYDATIAASGTLRARVSNSAGASTEALSQAYTYDATGPVISSISLDKEALSVGESARLTVVFSEKVSGLTLEAFGKHNSMLSSLEASADGKTWTAVVTMGNEGHAVDALDFRPQAHAMHFVVLEYGAVGVDGPGAGTVAGRAHPDVVQKIGFHQRRGGGAHHDAVAADIVDLIVAEHQPRRRMELGCGLRGGRLSIS
eukprot:gene28589-32290_t